MTAIAAISTGSKVYIGADSAGCAGNSLELRKDSKVFESGKFLMGFTSSFRMGQILRYSFKAPGQEKKIDDVTYMNTRFVDAVRKCLKIGGYARNVNGEENGGTFVVGYKGSIYVVESDFQVAIPLNDYTAVGCGADLCLGSLHTTERYDISPQDRIMLALDAAESYSCGVRGPFVVMSK